MYELFLPVNLPKWVFWVTLIGSYSIGVWAGIYIVKHQRYCFCLVGIYLGMILALFTFNMFMYRFIPEVSSSPCLTGVDVPYALHDRHGHRIRNHQLLL